MSKETRYRVVSASEGHITDREERRSAEIRADELNGENGLPDDHTVEKHVEYY